MERYTTTNGRADQGVSVFDKYTESWQINPGLKFQSGLWKADLVGGASKSINHYRNDNNFGSLSIATQSGLGWTVVTPRDNEVPTSFVQNSGPSVYALNNYIPNQGSLVATVGEHRFDPISASRSPPAIFSANDRRTPRWDWSAPDNRTPASPGSLASNTISELLNAHLR